MYATLTDQYESTKNKKVEVAFEADEYQLSQQQNLLNMVRKKLEWYKLH